ncbi:MAG: DJ-1/PfpI family protein [Deltaproteobacteria bacterium]|nr:DJ-1/PfpI family protein [Deltaproteobacteria bacterium]MBW2359345.1 DJ-1/PfpI family protein [Deltaproteobacteria bacterium]
MSDVEASLTLGAIFYDGFELLDVYGPLEMFACVGPQLSVVSVAERAGPVSPLKGPATLAEYGFDDCPDLDLILLPGGLGSRVEVENEKLLDFLRERAPAARITMSVCTGSALLAKAGLLDGLRATSNKLFFDFAVQQSDRVEWVEAARWVDAGALVTSSGVSAGMDMALAVIERLFSKELAERIAELTEYERHTDASRDPFVRCLNAALPKG